MIENNMNRRQFLTAGLGAGMALALAACGGGESSDGGSEEGTGAGGEQSVGTLVRDATTHLSTLVRGEIELAKTEITGEVKKGVKGSVFFILALAVLAFSMFFLFFTLAEGLHALGIWRWASFGITFLLMLLVAGVFGLLGYRRVRKIR
ncbi:MAG: phage holin family protein, partial [Atopobiaceae bacterium]|nr:phage holin family protein [Atopobiaceae bacterium]